VGCDAGRHRQKCGVRSACAGRVGVDSRRGSAPRVITFAGVSGLDELGPLLDDNSFSSCFGLPERAVHGKLSLRNNAFEDLREFIGCGKIVIDGDLDLSGNRRLRDLDGISTFVIQGDLHLVDIPANAIEPDLSLRGRIFLSASQTQLADHARRRGFRVVVI
jgi:hypothetical protein